MTQEPRSKNAIDVLLDVFVFSPVGLLTNCRDVVPELAAKGRQFVGNARFVGRFAVQQGHQEATGAVSRLLAPQTAPEAAPDPDDDSAEEVDPVAVEEHIPVRLEDVTEEGLDTVTWESVGEDELAIPSYASLAASQVVARLEGLSPDELEAVRRFEVAHRARKTVLGKIAQLQRS